MSTTLFFSLLVGAALGRIAAGWAAQLLADIPSTKLGFCERCHVTCSADQRWLSAGPLRCRACGHRWTVYWPLTSALLVAVLFAGYAWMLTVNRCQNVVEVQPATAMHLLRLPFHLVFLFLLTVATITDLLDYVIPDEVMLLGVVTAVTGAALSGDLQIIHVWVNWDAQIPGLYGPYLPDWMKHHHHLHGLVWSLTGMTVGAALIWLVRAVSGWVLRQPAMGLGDVTLTAMIGAFMGWQPTLCAISIAPLTAVLVGTLVRVTSGRSFVAFGPYLAVSAVIVLSSWRWIWAEPLLIRDVFSHWPSVMGIAGGALLTLAILLAGLRFFLSVPVDTIRN